MAEWTIAAVLKTAGANDPRGFESLSLRISDENLSSLDHRNL